MNRHLLWSMILVFALQTLIFNHMVLFHRYVPYVMPLLLALIPTSVSLLVLMMCVFLVGILNDIVGGLSGSLTASLLIISLLRNIIGSFFLDPSKLKQDTRLTFRELGYVRFILMTIILTFSLRLLDGIIDTMNLSVWIRIMPYIAISALIDSFFITIVSLVYLPKQEKR